MSTRSQFPPIRRRAPWYQAAVRQQSFTRLSDRRSPVLCVDVKGLRALREQIAQLRERKWRVLLLGVKPLLRFILHAGPNIDLRIKLCCSRTCTHLYKYIYICLSIAIQMNGVDIRNGRRETCKVAFGGICWVLRGRGVDQ